MVGVPSGRKSGIWAARRFATIPDLIYGISLQTRLARSATFPHLAARPNGDDVAVYPSRGWACFKRGQSFSSRNSACSLVSALAGIMPSWLYHHRLRKIMPRLKNQMRT